MIHHLRFAVAPLMTVLIVVAIVTAAIGYLPHGPIWAAILLAVAGCAIFVEAA